MDRIFPAPQPPRQVFGHQSHPAPTPANKNMHDTQNSLAETCQLERRPDGALLVRVPSKRQHTPPLPDAVFTFRAGDPQFDYWQQLWVRKASGQA